MFQACLVEIRHLTIVTSLQFLRKRNPAPFSWFRISGTELKIISLTQTLLFWSDISFPKATEDHWSLFFLGTLTSTTAGSSSKSTWQKLKDPSGNFLPSFLTKDVSDSFYQFCNKRFWMKNRSNHDSVNLVVVGSIGDRNLYQISTIISHSKCNGISLTCTFHRKFH